MVAMPWLASSSRVSSSPAYPPSIMWLFARLSTSKPAAPSMLPRSVGDTIMCLWLGAGLGRSE